MAAFDRRLLQRAREARTALAADAVLGLVAALLVLAQAVLLAHVAARSFDGASLREVLRPLVLLCAVVCARAAAAWGFEVVGRRAAGRILSRLRLDLVERRLRGEPAAHDGAESSEPATLAVALVAVTVGVRLVDGGLGFQAGLTVLVLAPELYLPLRNVAAQFHASADGAAVAGRLLDLTAVPPAPAIPFRRGAPDLRTATIQLEQVTFRYPGRPPALECVDLELVPAETVGLVGPS